MRFCTRGLDLYVNYRVTANPTLPMMTVKPETPLINTVSGVSGDSSDDGRSRRADINRPHLALSQQHRHHLDLQVRFGRPSPYDGDRAHLERDHVRPQNRDVGDLPALRGRKRPENRQRTTQGLPTRWVLNRVDQWHALGCRAHGGVDDALSIHNLHLTLRVLHGENRHSEAR